MIRTDAIIIGGGQAGLAMSRCLTRHRIDHVVLERGEVAQRWRTERWDSLRLLTPRWQSRLPDWHYRGDAPDGFMSMPEVIDTLSGYAAAYDMPVHTHTAVHRVSATVHGYHVDTDRGAWSAPNVVIATGHCDVPHVPRFSRALTTDVRQLAPSRYRNPDSVSSGGVLVVGASASGIQLADELAGAGREVVLAVGRHARMPRRYRGRDIMWWLDRMGRLSEPLHPGYDRSQPSLQLVGSDDGQGLDLRTLQDRGVQLVGRAVDANGTRVAFADDLADTVAAANAKLARTLARIDAFIESDGDTGAAAPPPAPMARIRLPPAPTAVDLRARGIDTVLWATGFRRSYHWLDVPVTDARGDIRHRGGMTAAPGLVVLGLQYQQRRSSSFLDGVSLDARVLADHIAARLGASRRRAA